MGRLDVDGRAFLEDRNIGEGYLPLTGAALDDLSGEGWRLTISEGWQIAPGKRRGDFVLRRAP